MRPYSFLDIARVCHEANRAYCATLGDRSQPPWDEAPQWVRESVLAGIRFHLSHPEADATASHNEWLAYKQADGWRYGPTKDPERKEHPNMVPFEVLPVTQQIKDWLFRQTVYALAPILAEDLDDKEHNKT